MRDFSILLRVFVAVVVAAGLSACASTQSGMPQPEFLARADQPVEPRGIADPLEKQNRAVFEDNQEINHHVIYPLARAYNENVPVEVRDRIDAFTTNLGEPVVFANDILQLRLESAATTLGRFALNSTIGLGGLFDVAATQQMPHQSGDFGQTLYVWGFRDSPYLVLPILGPTNVRDALGSGIEFAAQIPAAGLYPTTGLAAAVIGHASTAGAVLGPVADLGKAGDMQALEQGSLDFYTMLRSVSQQKRQAELDEALQTSALTAPPVPPDPNAIEPVMVLTASPAFNEKLPPITKAKPPAAKQPPKTDVIVGMPEIVIQ